MTCWSPPCPSSLRLEEPLQLCEPELAADVGPGPGADRAFAPMLVFFLSTRTADVRTPCFLLSLLLLAFQAMFCLGGVLVAASKVLGWPCDTPSPPQ